jgi:ribosome-binding protein aMBF1 (putative translation factor)
MITGAQIREGRRLVSLGPRELARRAKISVAVVERAERVDGEPMITTAQAHALQRTLEAAGVEFLTGTVRVLS